MLHRHLKTGSKKPVVCLHGLGATGASFDRLVGELDGKVETYVFDLLGFGKSPDLPSESPVGVMDRHVEAVFDELAGIDQPIAIVGHSMGGRIALKLHEKLAGESTSRAGPLVLIAPALGRANFGLIVNLLEDGSNGSDTAETKARRTLEAVRVVPPTDEDVDKYAVNFEEPMAWMIPHSPALSVPLNNYETKISGVNAPLIFVWGNDVPLLAVPSKDSLEELNGAAELVYIKGCGHIPHEEKPDDALPPIVAMLHDWADK